MHGFQLTVMVAPHNPPYCQSKWFISTSIHSKVIACGVKTASSLGSVVMYLNRNVPFHWNSTASSGDPCRYDYKGLSAAREMETKQLIKYLQENLILNNIKTFISLHSYSQMIMFPYGHTADRVENYDDLSAIGRKASEKIKQVSGRIYKSGSIYETIYPSSGGSIDCTRGELKIPITFSFELRRPPDSKDLFILPAAEIEYTAQEALAAIMTIIEESESRGYYS